MADWYLEVSKQSPNPAFLNYLYINCLRLVHPFTPFVSETLYQALNYNSEQPLLINSCWSDDLEKIVINQLQADRFEAIKAVITKIRQLIPLNLRAKSHLILEDSTWLEGDLPQIWNKLTAITDIKLVEATCQGILLSQIDGQRAWLSLDAATIKTLVSDLNQELQQLQTQQQRLQSRLKNSAYLKKAPIELINQSRSQAQALEMKLKNLQQIITDFQQVL